MQDMLSCFLLLNHLLEKILMFEFQQKIERSFSFLQSQKKKKEKKEKSYVVFGVGIGSVRDQQQCKARVAALANFVQLCGSILWLSWFPFLNCAKKKKSKNQKKKKSCLPNPRLTDSLGKMTKSFLCIRNQNKKTYF